jgi:hypothetical protein
MPGSGTELIDPQRGQRMSRHYVSPVPPDGKMRFRKVMLPAGIIMLVLKAVFVDINYGKHDDFVATLFLDSICLIPYGVFLWRTRERMSRALVGTGVLILILDVVGTLSQAIDPGQANMASAIPGMLALFTLFIVIPFGFMVDSATGR